MGKAFTLIELVVVVAIIGVLAGVVAPSAFRAIEKAKISAVIADAKSIKTAAYNMYADTGLWPGSNWNNDPTDPLQDADVGEGFVFEGDNPVLTNRGTWNGPYLQKWKRNPWGGWYFWDWNEGDQNGDGINREHVLWIDNGGCGPRGLSNAGRRIPLRSRIKIDEKLDDGNLRTGRIQVWQGDNVTGNFGFILVQGE